MMRKWSRQSSSTPLQMRSRVRPNISRVMAEEDDCPAAASHDNADVARLGACAHPDGHVGKIRLLLDLWLGYFILNYLTPAGVMGLLMRRGKVHHHLRLLFPKCDQPACFWRVLRFPAWQKVLNAIVSIYQSTPRAWWKAWIDQFKLQNKVALWTYSYEKGLVGHHQSIKLWLMPELKGSPLQ